jgi:predicted phage replisome organizer
MSEVKWIQIATGIFDNRKIKQIERMPEGDAIIVVWIKLLCLAGTCNKSGMIYLTEEIPYTDEMLATEFGMEQPQRFNVLKLALRTFINFKMIEIIDDVYFISSWEKYQNTDALNKIREQTRLRVSKHRESKKLLCNVTVTEDVTQEVTQCNATDKEKEIDKDIYK